MKTLEEYIESKNIEEQQYDFIDKEFVEYFINEWNKNHIPLNSPKEYLIESKITYDGQIEQAELINKEFTINKDNNIIKISKNKFKGISNVYFKAIYITIYYTNDNDEHGEYKCGDSKYNDYNEVRWDIKNKIFNFIEISVYVNENSISIKDVILHELKHAWDDYNSFKNYGTILDIAANDPKYKRFASKSNNDDEHDVKQINNMFSKIEQSSYITQFMGQITDILNNKKFSSISLAIKELIKSEQYKRYKNIKNYVMLVLTDKQYQKTYIDIYKRITNTSLSDIKIINKLEYEFNNFWFKLQKGIYQYIEDHHLITESIMSYSTNKFIKSI